MLFAKINEILMKTVQNDESVEKFIAAISKESQRDDCVDLMNLMKEITQEEPKMWGEGIVGFGKYHYKHDEKREGDWCLTGLSPRQKVLTVYMNARPDDFSELVKNLGTYTLGTTSIYFVKLSDVNIDVLREIIEKSVEKVKKIYV